MDEIYDMAEIYEDASGSFSVTKDNSSLVNHSSSRASKKDTIIGKEIITCGDNRKIDSLRSKVRHLEILLRSSGSTKADSEVKSVDNRDDIHGKGRGLGQPRNHIMEDSEEVRDENLHSNTLPSFPETIYKQIDMQTKEISTVKNDFSKHFNKLQEKHMKLFEDQKIAYNNAQAEMETRLGKLLEVEIRKVDSKMSLISADIQKAAQRDTSSKSRNISSEQMIKAEPPCELEQFTLLEVTDRQRSRILELQDELEEVCQVLESKNDQIELLSRQENEILDLKAQLANAKVEINEKEKRIIDQVEKTRKRDIRISKLRNELSRSRRALLKLLPPQKGNGPERSEDSVNPMKGVKALETEIIKARTELRMKGAKYANRYLSSDDSKSTTSKTSSISSKGYTTISAASKAE